jgi:CRP/FNR family cyclic AMP-dependent transcriptional regulator
MKAKLKSAFDADAFLRSAGSGNTVATYQPSYVVFSQGDAADSVFYIQKGAVKLAVLSPGGKRPSWRCSDGVTSSASKGRRGIPFA